jgi:hypothetical protein
MSIFITARGQYMVMDIDRSAKGVFDNLKDAIASVRMCNKEPIFEWDRE